MSTAKKTAVVTGGSRGIGFAVVKQLASEGYNVAVLDVNALEDYRANFNELDAMGADYLYYQGSVTEGDGEGKPLP